MSVSELRRSVEELHAVFAHYARPAPLVDLLSSSERMPLSAIGLTDLERLDSEVGLCGDPAAGRGGGCDLSVLKHLLPRLLDVWAGYRSQPHRRAALAERLTSSDWQRWPIAEVHAIENYLLVQWSAFLSPPATQASETLLSSADELLSAMSMMLPDLGPFIEEWEADASARATRVLIELVSRHAASLHEQGRIEGAWWRDPGRGQISQWLRRPEVVGRLEDALKHPPSDDAEDGAQPSRARDYLSWMHPH